MHNPSLISDSFLLKTKIIEDLSELKREGYIITPAVSQILFADGSQLTLDQNRLTVTSPLGQSPFVRGQRYCAELPYVKATAIGINFAVNLKEFDFEKWFERLKITAGSTCLEVKVLYQSNCFITLTYTGPHTAKAVFNFHYDHKNVLGELKLDFVHEWEKNHNSVKQFIQSAFNN